MDERLAVSPEARHLGDELLEDPPRLAGEDGFDPLAGRIAVLVDAAVDRAVLLVDLFARQPRVALPEVEAGGGGDRDERAKDEPVPHRPRAHGEDDRGEE